MDDLSDAGDDQTGYGYDLNNVEGYLNVGLR